MTVEELIEALRPMPPSALVIMDHDDDETERTPAIVHYELGLVLIATDPVNNGL